METMQIQLNGKPETVVEGTTVADLMRRLFPAGRRVAVEVNLEIVPRTRHGSHRLCPGDRVEVVQAIGGG